MAYNLIGLSGKAHCGKNTIANLICQENNFVGIAFADKIKRILKELYDFDDELLWGPSENRGLPDSRYLHKAKGSQGFNVNVINRHSFKYNYLPEEDVYLTTRIAAQQLGEAMRECFLDTWINYLYKQVDFIMDSKAFYNPKTGTYFAESSSNYTGAVVLDVRHKNEFDSVKNRNGYMVRIKRDDSGLKDAGGKHKSECEQDEIPDSAFDCIFDNNIDINMLPDAVSSMMKNLLK